jgi:hypothetical protein
MIHYPKQTNVSRYADFIKKFNGCEIDLTKEIELFRAKDGKGIGKGAKPWIAAGIAQKVGRKKYYIMPTDEHWQAATSILKLRRNVYPGEYKKNGTRKLR